MTVYVMLAVPVSSSWLVAIRVLKPQAAAYAAETASGRGSRAPS